MAPNIGPGPGEIRQFVEEVNRKVDRGDKSDRMRGLQSGGQWMFVGADAKWPHKHPITLVDIKPPPPTSPNMAAIAKMVEETKKAPGNMNPPLHPDFLKGIWEVLTWVLGLSPKPRI
jgi:hypothetical protein